MSGNALVRQVHRWVSIVFTAAVIANVAERDYGRRGAHEVELSAS